MSYGPTNAPIFEVEPGSCKRCRDGTLKEQLVEQMIALHFNPPHVPHFGGAWEREIRSVKYALQVILKDQIVPKKFSSLLS